MYIPSANGFDFLTSYGSVSGQTPFAGPKEDENSSTALGIQKGAESAPRKGTEQNGGQPNERLSEEERREVEKLKERDREVRAHEAAHMAAAGSLATGGMNLTYDRGPDGRMYAVGGEVNIDTSSVPGDPEANIEKAEKIRRAALAPAEPSATDRRVAAEAAQMAAKARMELAKERQEEGSGGQLVSGALSNVTSGIAATSAPTFSAYA